MPKLTRYLDSSLSFLLSYDLRTSPEFVIFIRSSNRCHSFNYSVRSSLHLCSVCRSFVFIVQCYRLFDALGGIFTPAWLCALVCGCTFWDGLVESSGGGTRGGARRA